MRCDTRRSHLFLPISLLSFPRTNVGRRAAGCAKKGLARQRPGSRRSDDSSEDGGWDTVEIDGRRGAFATSVASTSSPRKRRGAPPAAKDELGRGTPDQLASGG